MLTIVNFNQDDYEFPCLIVLGCFDGIHKGHAELLKKAKLQAKINGLDLGVMLFAAGKSDKQIFSFDERLAILESFNVKFVLKVDYNDEFKKIPALDFLELLDDEINVKAYMSGKDFRFGAGAKGKSSTLKNFAEDEENGVWYMSVKDVTDGDAKISSSDIRALIENGDIVKANELLGRNYFVSGIVVQGAGRGAQAVGYPTMNIAFPEEKVQPKQGVYTVKCTVDGNVYAGIANYGARPTFDEENAVLEVYLEGFEGDAYGKHLTVEFLSYIRDIVKFESAEELKAQLDKDALLIKAIETECSNIADNQQAEATHEDIKVAEEVPAVKSVEAESDAAEEAIEEVNCEACEELAMADEVSESETEVETAENSGNVEEPNSEAEDFDTVSEEDESLTQVEVAEQLSENQEFENELEEEYTEEIQEECEEETVENPETDFEEVIEEDEFVNETEEIDEDSKATEAEALATEEDEGLTQVEVAETEETEEINEVSKEDNNLTQVEVAEESEDSQADTQEIIEEDNCD